MIDLVGELTPSSDAWVNCVINEFDSFLPDHAANERKASAMAMSLVAHYPDRSELVTEMINLALEELTHFREVVRIMQTRQIVMPPDRKDPYVNQLRRHVREQPDEYFLDRLISGAVIEARGEERFTRLAAGLQDPELGAFYGALARAEAGHHQMFLRLAGRYFPASEIDAQLRHWLAIEQTTFLNLPVTPRLH